MLFYDLLLFSIKEHASHHSEGTEESGHAHQHEENPVPHIIGVSLVLGFIFMLIVDQVPVSFHILTSCDLLP